jgi:murein DD-endopeptidase MepM/ murein hydrolase activator NlpD
LTPVTCNPLRIPVSVKKISLNIAILLLKALVFVKDSSIRLGKHLHRPFSAFFSKICVPVAVFGYKVYRLAKLAVRDLIALSSGQATRLMTGRHAIQAVAILMAVLVADTNIRASNLTAADVGSREDKSVLEVMTDQTYSDDTEPLLEDMTVDETPAALDRGYLDGEAVISEAPPMLEDSAADGSGNTDATAVPEPFLTAVQEQPDMPAGASEAPATNNLRTRVIQYVVEEGDAVASIAEKFHLKPSTLIAVNGLSSRAIIRPGMTLKVPPVDGIIYVVKRGDTVGLIARRLSAEVADILGANNLGEDGSISVGMEVIVPGGKLPTPVVVPRSPSYARVPSQSSGAVTAQDADDSAVAVGRMLWPAGVRRISQYYRGARHTGLDIAGPVGTPLYAASSGTVTYAGWNSGGYGYMTIIDHENGYFTRYGHQSRILVKVGDSVRRGQVIGLMGNTGRSTGPHLHFEVMRGNVRNRLNPLSYIK